MKIGDLVRCKEGTLWLIYNTSEHGNFLNLVDPITHKTFEYKATSDIIEVLERPSNVEWLFILRRLKEIKAQGLESFV